MVTRSKTLISSLKITLLLAFLSVFLPSARAQQFSGQILGGTPDAPVRIEVFSDFQCPSCRELYLEVMRRVLADYSAQNKVCLIYHEFPLPMHRFSREAARYSEAVSRLGREQLIKVYDTLFMDQAQWSEDGSVAATVAKALTRTDFQKLKKIMEDPAINATIDREVKLGNDNKIQSTPTFFIYSGRKQLQKVEGRLTYIALKQYLDTIIK